MLSNIKYRTYISILYKHLLQIFVLSAINISFTFQGLCQSDDYTKPPSQGQQGSSSSQAQSYRSSPSSSQARSSYSATSPSPSSQSTPRQNSSSTSPPLRNNVMAQASSSQGQPGRFSAVLSPNRTTISIVFIPGSSTPTAPRQNRPGTGQGAPGSSTASPSRPLSAQRPSGTTSQGQTPPRSTQSQSPVRIVRGPGATESNVRAVRDQIARVPSSLTQGISGLTVLTRERGGVGGLFPAFASQRPPGYPPGSTWGGVRGAFIDGHPYVVTFLGPNGERVVGRGGLTAPHELGHAVDRARGRESYSPAFLQARDRDWSRLGTYQQQEGRGAGRGARETYAESFARYFSRNPAIQQEMRQNWPHLYAFWQARFPSHGLGRYR